MEEFANLIYENWQKDNIDRALFFKKGEEMMNELQDILSLSISEKIYNTFCDSCQEIERNAFIDGFAYAVKCLSNGKVELKGGVVNE